MDAFEYRGAQLCCEEVAVDEALAERFGTPAYIYSKSAFSASYDAFVAAFHHLGAELCYSVKSCSNLSLLRLLAERGASFDVVSAGELTRVVKAGAAPRKVVFAGVGKTDEELSYALGLGIHHFNVECEGELERLDSLARRRGLRASVALRLNPDVDAGTHRYITTGKRENKFGLAADRVAAILARRGAFPGLAIEGLHTHIGSQIQDPEPYRKALTRTLDFLAAQGAAGQSLQFLNIGGGFGVDYRDRRNIPPERFAELLTPLLAGRSEKILLEPGRAISANAGLLLTRVIEVKRSSARRFIIVDAAMNDLIRPSLYEAYHEIWPTCSERGDPRTITESERGAPADVVGPICETGDFLALDRPLPELERGALLAVFSAGAYGASMSSNYNSRPRAPEVLISGSDARLIRRRETMADLLGPEL